MMHRFLLCVFGFALAVSLASLAQKGETYYDRAEGDWSWGSSSDEGGSGSSYLGVDIADVSAERLAELKLKEEHGAEITMVDQDAPAAKAGLHEHDVIVSVNGTAVDSAAQLRRMIKETPPGRVVNLGISRDGQAMTIKVQLADRHKSMSWEPQVHVNIPPIPNVPAMPDFDMPVSVVIVHQSARSGLMVENLSAQLGDFFGVKDGKGVLVRSVEKGSRGEKAGFRAGDVVIKVNSQPVHDTSDFTHALRSSASGTAAVTVMRDRKEQNLTLTLEKKDTGSLQEDTFDIRNFTAQTEQAISRANQVAQAAPSIDEAETAQEQTQACQEERQKELQEQQEEMREQAREGQQELQERQDEIRRQAQEMQDRAQELQEEQQERQDEIRIQPSKKLADI